ncbi:hypothetical protein AcV5_010031 [Taiwanofungus camphoratus]|nr:hypothetical protein AcV5_010031 [Antrodia cinnamomea]KAI0945929.1 hypothetical protein AcV7_010041 [Antrodia cinnamomea]
MSNEGATRLLPAPCSDGDSGTTKLEVGSESGLKFDALGPMVVNRDGSCVLKTLSRIANWQNMTEFEKQRTMRVLIARNK